MPKRLTKNFMAYEFSCSCGCGYGEMAQGHMDKIQQLRDAVGEGLSITSGIRCREYNDTIDGAAERSWHIPRNGITYACDLTFAGGSRSNQRILKLATLAEQLHFKGLIIYPRRVHLDSRPGRRYRGIDRHWSWKDS